MLNYLYPADERILFTDRKYRLGLLETCCTELVQGYAQEVSSHFVQPLLTPLPPSYPPGIYHQ